jgi:uncharacterized protein (TIGR00251 family)
MTSYKDAIKESNLGVLLCLHVVPGSTQTTFPVQYNPWRNSIEIKVQSEAKEHKANTETIETVAGFFQLSVKDVVLVSGEKKREKTVCLKNISIRTVNAKLEKFFHG